MTSHPPHVTHPLLAEGGTVRHGFFGRRGGVSQGIYQSLNCGPGSSDDDASVARNRALAVQALAHDVPLAEGALPPLVTAHQVHSSRVVIAREPWSGDERPKADAIVTDCPGIAVAVLTADCAPVLFADAEAGIVAAAHAGWRGAHAGITDQTVACMERLGARRERIAAVVGPAIGPRSYEVGPDLRDAVVADAPDDAVFFRPGARGDRLMFDLPGYVATRLRRAGLRRIATIDADTYALPGDYFSYRRTCHRGEPDYGRQLSAIMRLDMSAR